MANTLKINRENNTIVMDRAFAKASEIVGSREYNMLQVARKDYPNYVVVQRKIKKNPNKESYKGLTYEYMENYIKSHCEGRLAEYMEMRLLAECHSVRYPTIKKWFLDAFPEVAEFSVKQKTSTEEMKSENIFMIHNTEATENAA